MLDDVHSLVVLMLFACWFNYTAQPRQDFFTQLLGCATKMILLIGEEKITILKDVVSKKVHSIKFWMFVARCWVIAFSVVREVSTAVPSNLPFIGDWLLCLFYFCLFFRLFGDTTLSDVFFIVKNVEFQGHTVILRARAPNFCQRYLPSHSSSVSVKTFIQIHGLEATEFETFLRYKQFFLFLLLTLLL